MGVGRIYSILGEVVKRGGSWIFSNFRGELAYKGGVTKFRGEGVWTLDEAMLALS